MGLRMKSDKIRQFTIDVASEVLSDLRQRLKKTRSSYQIAGTDWDAGTDGDYLKELVDYWQDTYDWRKHETALNKFTHFKTDVDDIDIHFINERGKGANPFPLILTHGYPDSFYRFAKIIPMLTDPESFGGRADDAFDVIVPDLPGYGFSDKPKKHGAIFRVNDLWARLMTDKLGYANLERMVEIGAVQSRNNSRAATPTPLLPFISPMCPSVIYLKNPTTLHLLKSNFLISMTSGYPRRVPTRRSSLANRRVSLMAQ